MVDLLNNPLYAKQHQENNENSKDMEEKKNTEKEAQISSENSSESSDKQIDLDDIKEEEPFAESDYEDEIKSNDDDSNSCNTSASDYDSDHDNNTLLLDKDIKIAKILRSKKFKKIDKIITTDQGSTWRAKMPIKKQKSNRKSKSKNKQNERSTSSQSVVIKIASKLLYDSADKEQKKIVDENILKEIEILKLLNAEQEKFQKISKEKKEFNSISNMIIRVIDTIEDDEDNYMVVLEDGGSDLFTFTQKVHNDINNGSITIEDWQLTIKEIAKRVSELLHWMHDTMHLCHLDISLENLLISNIEWIHYKDEKSGFKKYKKRLSNNFRLKLIDFGACQKFEMTDDDKEDSEICFSCTKYVGKPSYCSPQIFNLKKMGDDIKPFDARAADVFSFGVTLFILMIGCRPWTEPDEMHNQLFQQIVILQNLDFILKGWRRESYVTNDMKNLLQKIFVMSETNRITFENIRKHKWLNC